MVVRKPRSSGDKLVIFSGRYSLISRGAGQLMSRPYSLAGYTVDPYSLKMNLTFNSEARHWLKGIPIRIIGIGIPTVKCSRSHMTKETRKVTLKVIRAMKGKKQSDIALRLKELGRNADQKQVSKWENGETTPTIEAAIDMAKAYEVSIVDLLRALGFDLEGVDIDNATNNRQGGNHEN
jgi:DNA-binding XRE family transcriptional regulator